MHLSMVRSTTRKSGGGWDLGNLLDSENKPDD